MMTTGIWRVVFFSYSANGGMSCFCFSQIGVRSASSGTRALAENVSLPISIVTSGLATRLWYQAGLSGAPPFDAKTATRPSPRSW